MKVFIKCYECGKEVDIDTARKDFIYTKNKHAYCQNCVIRLYNRAVSLKTRKDIKNV